MIKPIDFVITNGVSKAVTKFEQDGVQIKFDKPTPDFAKQVGKIVDTFMYSDKIDKTPQGLQQLVQDTFERSNNATK